MLYSLNKYKLSGVSEKPNYRIDAGNCVTYEEVSYIDGILCIKFYYTNLECYLENPTANIYIIDAKGCENEIEVDVCNPCENFELLQDTIKHIEGLKFLAQATLSKNMPYTYEWLYNRNQLSIVRQDNNLVEFEYVTNGISQIEIGVKIINSNNCCLVYTKIFDICQPQGNDIISSTICTNGVVCSTVKIDVSLCDNGCNSEAEIDWSTLNINTPKNVSFTHIKNGEVKFIFPDTFPKSVVSMSYYVCDIQNKKATGNICISVIPCPSKSTVAPITGELGCKDCSEQNPFQLAASIIPEETQECRGESVKFDIDKYLVSNYDFNYDSFTFIAGESDVLISNTEISTPSGNAIFGTDRRVCFIPTSSVALQQLNFKIQDSNNQIAYGQINIYRSGGCSETTSGAETVNDNICMRSGECIVFNPLNNDLGDYDPSSLDIEIPPLSKGTITKYDNGDIEFCAASDYSGVLELSYTVKDSNGILSNSSIIKFNVYPNTANAPIKISYCRSDATNINLYSIINGTIPDFRWRLESVKSKFSINNVDRDYYKNEILGVDNNVSINFSNSPSGLYLFSYGDIYSSCGNLQFLEIEIVDAIAVPENNQIDLCISLESFDISKLISSNLSGQWVNVTPGNITGTIISPSSLGIGIYKWQYRVNNYGLHNQVCDSVYELSINITDIAYAGENNCIDACSKVYIEDVNCKEPIENHVTCNISLFDNLITAPQKNITEGGYWYLVNAPQQNHNILFINGVKTLVNIGDKVGINYIGQIDFGGSMCGEYHFVYKVGLPESSCYDESQIIVNVKPAPCQPSPITLKICSGLGIINLWEKISRYYVGECKPLLNGTFELISGDASPFTFTGNCNDTLDTSKVSFNDDNEDVEFKLLYKSSIINNECEECDECLACLQVTEICISVYHFNNSGIAAPKTTSIGDCGFNLNLLLENYSNGGTWKYDGFSINNLGIDTNSNQTIDSYSKGDIIKGNVIQLNGVVGYYYFTYTVSDDNGCCSKTQTILQLVENGNSGDNYTQEVSNACLDLLSDIGGDAGGTWYNINNAPLAPTPCNSIASPTGFNSGKLNTTGMNVGEYMFIYFHTLQANTYELLFNNCSAVATAKINII